MHHRVRVSWGCREPTRTRGAPIKACAHTHEVPWGVKAESAIPQPRLLHCEPEGGGFDALHETVQRRW